MSAIIGHSVRRYLSVSAVQGSSAQGPSAVSGHGSGGYKLWKRLSFLVALPSVGLCMLNAYLKHQEEHGAGHHQPDFVAYQHLRIRTKRFPWGEGQKSLFHNEHTNPLPGGYEHSEH